MSAPARIPGPETVPRDPDGRVVLPCATLGIGGRVIRFRAERPGVRFAVMPPHDAFLLPDDTEADCELAVAFGPVAPSPGPARFDAAGHWELRTRPDGGDEVCFFGRVSGEEPEPMTLLSLAPDLSRGRVVQLPFYDGGHTFPVGFPLDEYVGGRVLGRAGAVVLHATALLDGDEAIVFAGHSGAGKSTIAKVAEECGAEVLSDDRTVLTADGRSVRAHGTPWHGSLKRGAARSAPVRALYLLSQSPVDAVEELSVPAALRELYVRVIQPSVDAAEAEAALDTLEQVVARVRVARLHFLPEPSAFALARADSRQARAADA